MDPTNRWTLPSVKLLLVKWTHAISPKMGLLGIQVSSYVVKNIYDFLNFLSKVEQCTTVEGKYQKFNLEL
jgi:hypothetical protein